MFRWRIRSSVSVGVVEKFWIVVKIRIGREIHVSVNAKTKIL